MKNSITDVAGIKVGHATDRRGKTGCTVLLFDDGAACGVDVRGSAPGTRETDLLAPGRLVEKVNGIVLTGGSAYGLDAACGVVKYLEEKGQGFRARADIVVPVVPAAVIYDLEFGSSRARPNARMGYKAAKRATRERVEEGSVGVGTGATVGKIKGMASAAKGGVASLSKKLPGGVILGVLVVTNSFGNIVDPKTGEIIAGVTNGDRITFYKKHILSPFVNTTLGVVAVDISLSKAELKELAGMAQDGFARAIRPVHTMVDGDTVFAVASGKKGGSCDISMLGSVAADLMAEAIVRSVKVA